MPISPRVHVRTGLLLAAVLLAAAPVARPAHPASGVDGLCDAIVVANGAEVPFRFEIATNGADAQGFFFEGDLKVGSTSGRFADGVLTLKYDFLNTTLEATVDGAELRGTYKNNRAN